MKQALDPLREELNGERVDLGELVVLGAEAKLAHLRAHSEARAAAARQLADMIRSGEVKLDPARADEAKRAWLPR